MKRIVLNISLITVVILALCAGFTQSAQANSGKLDVRLVRAVDMSHQGVTYDVTLAVDRDLNTYVVDGTPDNPRVLKYDKHGHFVLAWGGKGSGPGQFEFWPATSDGGPNAGFIAVDSHGNIYVSDAYNYRVQKFDSHGHFLMQFGEAGSGNGQFDPPCAGPIYVDKQDNIWVSTFPRVQKFHSRGHFLASYGSAGSGNGEFNAAAGVAVDHLGNIYIADALNARIQKLDSHGHFLKAWGTPGTGNGQFFMPTSMVLDNEGRLFVADNTNRVQVFTTDGKFLGKWTEPGKGYPPLVPNGGLAIDRYGNIYVPDIMIYVFSVGH